MAFLVDLFDEASTTLLSDHAPDTGGTWVKHSGSGTTTASVSGGNGYVAGSSGSASAYYYNNAAPASADYAVSSLCNRQALTTAASVGVMGRLDASALTGYMLRLHQPNVELYRVVAGSFTLLLTGPSTNQYQDYELELSMAGDVISAKIDGAHISGSPYTDASPVTAAGFAGIIARQNGRINDIDATDAAGGGTTLSPGAGRADVTGYAPTNTQPNTLTPGAGRADVTGYAPGVSQLADIRPGAGRVTATGYAPIVAQPITVAPGAGSASATGYAPVVTQGSPNDIRLEFGVYREAGGSLGAVAGLFYEVMSDDRSTVVQYGTLTTASSGLATIDIDGSPWVVGDYVRVNLIEYVEATAPQDRTVKAMVGFVPAIAQT